MVPGKHGRGHRRGKQLSPRVLKRTKRLRMVAEITTVYYTEVPERSLLFNTSCRIDHVKTTLWHIGEAIVSSISVLLNLPVVFIAAKFVTACGRQQHAEILSAF